ncbi:Dabb family protein, partial [Alcaligenes faecalis]|uniref:Dabb family protein n=1 Tax=Alcaligenes faecalis TaxID=511 RepID=UPI001E5506B4
KDSMYLHIVLMAPHTPVSPELAPKLDQAFIRIHQECPGIERFEWVPNLSRSSARYSHALLSVFRTQEALDAYRQSDAHQAMLDAIAPHIQDIVVLDSVLEANLP